MPFKKTTLLKYILNIFLHFFSKATTFFFDVARTESLFVLVLLVSLFSASSSVNVTFDGDLAGCSSVVGVVSPRLLSMTVST